MQNAYAPYSNFQVGCCVVSDTGKVFVGTNVENVAFHSTLCAESVAIGAMVVAGERKIAELVLVSSGEGHCFPCGNCRQIISEFCDSNTVVHMHSNEGHIESIPFTEMLPFKFHMKN